MRNGHDHVVVSRCIDLEIPRQRLAIDDQGVISRGADRLRATFEEALATMAHIADFSMNGKAPADDARAKSLTDCLMPEADAEERDGIVGADEVEDASGARRRAWSRRNDDRPRLRCDQCCRIERVVADDIDGNARKALDLLDQVVGEGVVVIDYDDRRGAKDAPGWAWSWGEDSTGVLGAGCWVSGAACWVLCAG